MQKIILLIFIYFSVQMTKAEPIEKRIFVLDGTASLVGYGGSEKVWHKVQPLLIDNIQEINEDKADLVLLVFADKIYHTIKGKKEILTFLNDFTPDLVKYTNIKSGWDEIKNHIDPTKFNFITFITDGEHNQPEVPLSALKSTIQNADNFFSKTNSFTCLVRLTEAAIQPQITEVLNSTKNITYIDGIKFPVILKPNTSKVTVNQRDEFDIEETIYFDIINEIDFPNSLGISLKIEGLKELAELSDSERKILKGNNSFTIKILKKGTANAVNNTEIKSGSISIKSNDKSVIVINNELKVDVINKPEKYASIDFNPNFGELRNYNKFLFWKEKTDTIFQTIKINWSDDAKVSNSEIAFNFKWADDQIEIFANDEKISKGRFIVNNKTDSVRLKLVAGLNSSTGKKFGDLNAIKTNLDRTNLDKPLEIFYSNSNVWNPLKWIVLIVSLLILILLLLWFLILRNILFKKFSAVTIQFSEPYFKNLKLKGARKVKLSSKRESQNLFNKIFKGEIIQEINPIWDENLILVPGKDKNSPIKIETNKNFEIKPFSIYLQRFNEYSIIKKDKSIIKIKIS